MTFDSDYFNSVNYTDYLYRGDRYVKLADEVMDLVDTLELPKSVTLDFGCAVGHLLTGLQPHCDYLYGSDISEWARTQAQSKNLPVTSKPYYDMQHDLVFSLDVFEHMSMDQLQDFFENIDAKVIIFRVPVAAVSGGDYVLEVSRRDPTHNIRWTKDEWRKFFLYFGYDSLNLNLHTIYNSEGVYSGIAIRYDKLYG